MSWRSQGITGSNNIPLGNRRRFGGDDGGAQDGGYVPSPSSDGMADSSYKRGRSPARGMCLFNHYSELLLTH
jgi:splicing factor 1